MTKEIRAQAEARWRHHLKPHRALGRLEEVTFRLVELREKVTPAIKHSRLLLFCADHGVAFRGVSAMDPSATARLIARVAEGTTAANIFCRHAEIELLAFDVGTRFPGKLPSDIVDCRVGQGTGDISLSSAMTDAQRDQAIACGRAAVRKAVMDGVELIGVGEIGIGNTTIAAALTSALLNLSPEETVDRGTGIDDRQMELKKSIVSEALRLHRDKLDDPLGCLSSIGGFEFAAIVGTILACSEIRTPIVIDGFATAVAALIAQRISSSSSDVIFVSHMSRERGQAHIHRALKQKALFDLEFALGEGTGAVLGMQFLRLGSQVLAEIDCF